ncbi:phosphoribosylaminoimidazolesuccinocarboxamide synthase [Orenia marismortui]|uniref:hypothetical protein n=1 Tax=Orenia marismortui TaxID=46469 RepID=UPI00037AA05E|nr:hypothetical protein [Orenia marismortui]
MNELLERLNFEELKVARKLVNKYYKQEKNKVKSQILIDNYTNSYGVYFRLEKVFCNKSSCKKCQGGSKEGHGPYWYSYKNGKREYIGIKTKEELKKIKKFSKLLIKSQENRLPYKK